MAEPCLPDKLETWAYDDPDKPEHTVAHTMVLSSLITWLRSVPGLVEACASPPGDGGVPFTSLPSCVTWARLSLRASHCDVGGGGEVVARRGGGDAMPWPEGVKVSALIVFGNPSGMPPIVRGVLGCPALSGLTELDLEGCETLTDDNVRAACTRLPNLTLLDVKGAERYVLIACVQITRVLITCALIRALIVRPPRVRI